MLLRRALTVQIVQKMRGFHSAVLGDAVDHACCFSATGAGLGSANAENSGGSAVAVYPKWSMSLVCSSSTRCGRPCDYAATGFCSRWRSHSAYCAEDQSFHGAVLGWLSTRPLVCKRQGYGSDSAENCGFRRCSALTRFGRPCEYAATQSRSGRCHRYSSSPDLVDIPVCTETGFAVGCDDGFFDAFCVIFRTPQ